MSANECSCAVRQSCHPLTTDTQHVEFSRMKETKWQIVHCGRVIIQTAREVYKMGSSSSINHSSTLFKTIPSPNPEFLHPFSSLERLNNLTFDDLRSVGPPQVIPDASLNKNVTSFCEKFGPDSPWSGYILSRTMTVEILETLPLNGSKEYSLLVVWTGNGPESCSCHEQWSVARVMCFYNIIFLASNRQP